MNIIILVIITIVGMSLFPLKGSAMGATPNKAQEIQTAYKNIDFSDGVDEKEAMIIAKQYIFNDSNNLSFDVIINSADVGESGLKNVIGNCWAVSFDAKWKVRRRTGLKWYTIHIDKLTGEIKVKGWGPS